MRVVVVGGGFAGLFAALELIHAGIDDVLVVEGADHPGGVARTLEKDGYTLEPAVGSMTLPHPDLGPMLDRVGAALAPVDPSAAARYVFAGGRLAPIASPIRAVLAPVLPPGAKVRAVAEMMVKRRPVPEEESLERFLRRRFGRGAGELIAWLMASGVYAGDPRRLSASAAFPMLTSLEEGAGSVTRGALRRRRSTPMGGPRPRLHVPVGAMSGLARSAARSLGDRFRAGFPVNAVRSGESGWLVEGPETLIADSVVVATGPESAAALVDRGLATHLRRSVGAPVVVVGLGGRGPSPLPPGFGALIDRGEGMASRGMLFESSYAPGRAPIGHWLVKLVAGGATNPDLADWDDDRLLDRVEEEVARVVGGELDISFRAIIRHLPGIPQYNLGHGHWLTQLDQMVSERPGLHLAGWGYRGVGLADLATDAARIRRRVSPDLA